MKKKLCTRLVFLLQITMMMDLPRDGIDDEAEDDSDRTESYTPPPLDVTTDHSGSEKENQTKDRQLFYADPDPIKEESIIVLDDSFEQTPIRKSHRPSTHLNDPPSKTALLSLLSIIKP